MTGEEARRLISETTARWVDDPESDVVWAGEYDGRLGIRMAQETRDHTTVWFDVGQRTVGYEAYLLPEPTAGRADFFRHCLARNASSWPAALALHRDGDVYVQGRIPLDRLSAQTLDEAVGAVYELVELSFRPLLRASRRTRENSG